MVLNIFLICSALTFCAAVAFLASAYMGFASLAFALLLAGVILGRVNRRRHALLMSSGVALDFILLLLIELQRAAIDTVMDGDLTNWQIVHVASSSGAILLYPIIIFLGLKAWKGQSHGKLHVKLGIFAILLRTIGFFTMFSLLDR